MAPSDDEITTHLNLVRELQRVPEFAADGPHATINNPQWFDRIRGAAHGERRALHREIIADLLAEHTEARQGHKAVVLAGPPGAGKSTLIRSGSAADVLSPEDRKHYVPLDADYFKEKLLYQAIKDGSYETFIKPARVKELEARGEMFSPLELASLVHSESSFIAQAARGRLLRDGTNVVIDTVLSSKESAQALSRELSKAGYTVAVIDVEVPMELSKERVAQRWRDSYVASLEGKDPLGGRWVPSEYIGSVYDADGQSIPRQNAEALARHNPNVMQYQVWYTTDRDATPAKIKDYDRPAPGAALRDRTTLPPGIRTAHEHRGPGVEREDRGR